MTDESIRPAEASGDLAADILATLKTLDEPVEASASTDRRFRVVVATDWSSAAVPFAVLQAFSQIIPVDAPVDLVFAVPHEAAESDLAALASIYEGLSEGTRVAGLLLESFSDAVEKHAYAVVVPSQDPDITVMELTHFLVTLHQLAVVVSDPEKLAKEPAPIDRQNAGLARRFAAFEASATA